MNSSIASTNNATLVTVAATYALKSVVDQLDRHPRRHHQPGQRPRLAGQRDLGPAGWHQSNP